MNDIIILQASLERIAVSLERISRALEQPPVTHDQPVVNPEPAPISEPEQIPETAPAVEPEQTKPSEPTVTLDQIRKQVVALCAMSAEKKDAVREIITAYGRNVSAIPADKYPEVVDKLTALQEG